MLKQSLSSLSRHICKARKRGAPLYTTPAAIGCGRHAVAAARQPLHVCGRSCSAHHNHSRAAATMAEVIVIPDSEEHEEESPGAAAAREAAQRQAIMAFARAKRASTGRHAGDGDPAAHSGGGSGSGRMQQPGYTPPQQGPGPAADPSDSTAPPAAGGSFDNSDLRALHEARMRRRQQQQPQEQQPQQQQQQQQQPQRDNAATSQAQDTTAAGAQRGRRRRLPLSFDADAPPNSLESDATQQQQQQQQPKPAAAAAGASVQQPQAARGQAAGGAAAGSISLLTYNVWFREDVAVVERMQGIGAIIDAARWPTFVCLQEVTPLIMDILASMPWWQRYVCSPAPLGAPYFTLLLVNKAAAPGASASSFEEVAFDNSVMGRSLRVATVRVGGCAVLAATSHLESPTPPQQWYSRERQQQMAFSLALLHKAPYPNILFAGDMNWSEDREGPPPLPPGWQDAWLALHAGEPGFSYDAKNNAMLAHNSPRLRLDRVFAKLHDFRPARMAIVGTEPLPGVTHTHTFRSGSSKELPVLPSDHFGLLLTMDPV